MAALRFNRVSIGGIHLSSDGTLSGTPCKLTVSNIDELLLDKTGSIDFAADGTAWIQLADVHGVALDISVRKLKQAVYDDLVDAFNDANNTGAKLTVVITGSTGSFSRQCFVNPKKPISPSGFINDMINDVTLRLVTD